MSLRLGQPRGPSLATNSWSTQPAWSRRGRRAGRMITRDPLGTWETLSSPSSKAAGDTAYQLQNDPRPRVPDRGGQTRDAAMVSPSEGNEVRRDGRQGVGALRSSCEAGGTGPPGPRGAKGVPRRGTGGRNHHEGLEPHTVSPRGHRIVRGPANPRCDEPDAGDPHVGICGSPGEQSSGRPGPRRWSRAINGPTDRLPG